MSIKSTDIRLTAIKDVKTNPANRNKHEADQIDRLIKIIEYQGFRNPLIVSNRTGMLVAGHGRLLAARKLRLKEVPVMFQDFEDDAQEYACMVSDNAIASWSELDLSGINSDIGDLGPDFDIDLLGIKGFEIEVADRELGDEDAVPAPPPEPITKRGDIYQLGRHRLMCGDSTVITDAEKLLCGTKAEMLFTDPPYGVDYSGGIQFTDKGVQKNNRKKLENDDSSDIYKEVMPIVALTVDGPCYTWFAFTQCRPTVEAIEAIGEMHALIIWHKTNATYGALNANYKQRHEPCIYWKPKGSTLRWDGPTDECTIWEIKRDPRNDLHPTQKPVELAERAINNHKAKTVLDLFGGSGSTMIACEKSNRTNFTMELDPIYCDVIVKRWENYTGQKAVLING